jgi:ribosomal protein S18 acetylase RimI-like enzyme
MTGWSCAPGRFRPVLAGKVRRVTVDVEELREVTDEVVEAFGRLLPQLSRSAPPLDQAALTRIVSAQASSLLIARVDGVISGTLTLVMFRIPTGLRAWIEDVVVDDAARGQGVASALTHEALRIARVADARTVDLSSRPSRVAAGRLYEHLGFEARDTRMYRYPLEQPKAP